MPGSDALLATADELRRLVEQVTPEEFSWQEANYGRDSELGCELLYLIANNEWARATSEIIDISQRRAVDTTIRIDVDLDRITHEAFRYRAGRLWLPVFVLPPPLKDDGPPWPEPDPFGTMTVTDDSGISLPTMAGAEVRHRISAALAEIIVNIASTRLPRAAMAGFAATRDHRLVLSAAIYRLLRSGASVPPAETTSRRGERETAPGASRLGTARYGLGVLLGWYAHLLEHAPGDGTEPARESQPAELPAGGGLDGTASALLLTERAVMVLQALAQSAVVVVAVRRNRTPAVLTLKLPSRVMAWERPPRWRLRDPHTGAWSRPGSWTWLNWRTWNWLLPRAQLDVDLLLPSADADRQVRVDLPAGVSFDPSRPPAELEVAVRPPAPFGHLRQLTPQLLDERAAQRAPALHRAIADMAAAMADAALESMREHRVAPPAPAGRGPAGQGPAAGHGPADDGAGEPDATVALYRKLTMLRRGLGLVAGPGEHAEARAELAKAWAGGEWLDPPLLRCSSCDQLSPGTVVTKTGMIEDRSRRGAPARARIHVHVAVTDAEYFSIARFSSRMSSLLMAVVLGFFLVTSLLGWKNSQVSADVLAFVLTLFSAVQAGRIERADRSTLHGLLSGAGSLLIVATVLPSVLLAVALAFAVSGLWPVAWAAGAIGLQLAIAQLLQVRRGWEHGLEVSPAAAASGLSLQSEPPDYAPGEVLHSGWWRGATANALLIGRPAFGYMIWQRDSSGGLRDLLSGARPAAEQAAQPARSDDLPVAVRARGRFRLSPRLPVTGIMLEADAADDDQPAVLELSPSGDLRAAVPEDASVLALQRSGTARQSVTFVVFREEPKADWVRTSEATAVRLEPDRLAPIEDGIASVEVFAGLPRDRGLRPVAEHPVSVVLDAAASCRLVVLDAQLPVPSPAAGYPGLLWARIRVALHDNELGQLGQFLDAIGAAGTDPPADDGLVVAVRTVADGPLRILNPRPGAGLAPAGLVLASDMDIMTAGPRGAGRADEKAWRLIAICADARAGVERSITRTVAGELRLAGLTYAHLYGKAVCVLVAHQGAPGSGLAPGRPRAGTAVYLNQLQSATDLGLARPEPVLRVQVRLPDRAGMTLAVLDSLRDMLPDLVPGGPRPVQWQVWYARSQLSEGNTGVITLTARLAVDPDLVAGWDQAVFEDLARQVRRRAMSKAPGGLRQTDSGFRAAEETELSVRLISVPRHDD
jgi:hypothetical protein